jgi:hypothetical protein
MLATSGYSLQNRANLGIHHNKKGIKKMALKLNEIFKGISVDGAYVRVARISNLGGEVELLLEIHSPNSSDGSPVEGGKGALIGNRVVRITDVDGLVMGGVYDLLKTELYPNALDV